MPPRRAASNKGAKPKRAKRPATKTPLLRDRFCSLAEQSRYHDSFATRTVYFERPVDILSLSKNSSFPTWLKNTNWLDLTTLEGSVNRTLVREFYSNIYIPTMRNLKSYRLWFGVSLSQYHQLFWALSLVLHL